MTAAVSQAYITSHADDELAALFMQLEEIDHAAQNSKGKNRIDQPLDFETVYAIFQAELEDYQNFLKDQKLAQSIGAAVHSDGAAIRDLTTQDIQAHNDRRLVLGLCTDDSGNEEAPESAGAELQNHIADWMSNVGRSVAPKSVFNFSDDGTTAGPSMTYAERQAITMDKLLTECQCISCLERFPRGKMISANCSHRYCTTCVRNYFVQSTKDATNFPPKCCQQPIPLRAVAKYMAPEELSAFHLAAEEFATTDRVYCSKPECATFIKSEHIQSGTQRATCSNCNAHTCAICKNAFHEGKDCPADPALQETRDLAQRLGWQTCSACKILVQLRSGCNHMTCLCGNEFCYVCGSRWKTCRCDPADMNRIEERTDDARSQVAPAIARNAEPMDTDSEVSDDFAVNPAACDHSGDFETIQFARNRFRCEECEEHQMNYISRCTRCQRNFCRTCHRAAQAPTRPGYIEPGIGKALGLFLDG